MKSSIDLNNRSLPVVLDSISVNDFSAFAGLERYESPYIHVIFAWIIPWTEKPGGLQSIESQRIGRD